MLLVLVVAYLKQYQLAISPCTFLLLISELVMLIGVCYTCNCALWCYWFYTSDTSVLFLHIDVAYCQIISLFMPL
jgi:hypothetical protein